MCIIRKNNSYIFLLVEMYFEIPGGTKIVMIVMTAAKPYEINTAFKLKLRIFENTSISTRYLKIDIVVIRKNETNKKKCKRIPIASHNVTIGKFLPAVQAKAM